MYSLLLELIATVHVCVRTSSSLRRPHKRLFQSNMSKYVPSSRRPRFNGTPEGHRGPRDWRAPRAAASGNQKHAAHSKSARITAAIAQEPAARFRRDRFGAHVRGSSHVALVQSAE
jgi:hypothetical protein